MNREPKLPSVAGDELTDRLSKDETSVVVQKSGSETGTVKTGICREGPSASMNRFRFCQADPRHKHALQYATDLDFWVILERPVAALTGLRQCKKS